MATAYMISATRTRRTPGNISALACLLLSALPLPAQLLSNLQSFPDRIAVGDPQTPSNDLKEGPKGIATADFNADGKPDFAVGNLDGTITVFISLGGGRFAAPVHLRTGAQELRAVLATDLNGDGKPDLAAASPMDGKLLVYFNAGSGTFPVATPLAGWIGVRSLAAGDFDGDGITDLAAAGPGLGLRHFRGTGGGAFEIMGDLPRLSPLLPDFPRPVYSLRTIRSRDGLRDDLLVTHADSPALWVLSTVPVNRGNEPPMDPARLPGWRVLPAPVLLHEVQVHNANTLRDSDGTAQPWAELLNKSAVPVNLEGWMLKSETSVWSFPPVTVAPGRMLVVFLSGKNRRTGPEFHTSFLLQQNSLNLSLVQPDGVEANTFTLTEHSVTDVSLGLAPDLNAVKYFDIPSPGAENNAGFNNPDDIGADTATLTSLTITPRQPAPGQSATVRLTMPEHPTGSSSVRNVWFSATPGLYEIHHLLHHTAPGVFEEVLPPGAFSGSTPHRVLARLRDGTGNDYTREVHRGLDEAQSNGLATPQKGRLLPVASVPSPKVKAFEIGPVFTRAIPAGAPHDLVFADDVCGLLRVHRAGPGARRFEPMPSQDVPVRGAPRDVKLADTDADGWLDATVVLRSMDLATIFINAGGILGDPSELPTGRSPRELVMADFTGDGKPDAAIINRYSADVSILPSSPSQPGLVSLDQIYSVNGEVAGLTVKDFNGDGRDDVMQLHRASGEISIRSAGPDGTLSAPVFRSVGTGGEAPSGVATADVNNDGRPDMLTANLGWGGNGSISVLLAKPDGAWETPRTFPSGGGMFAISVADFDSDGYQDVVAGLFDCRVAFFRGDGTGNFTSTYTVTFAYESRVMVTGDFDQDGDIDIAGAGYQGDMVTLENRGAATTADWIKRTYAAPGGGSYGTERIAITFVNLDSDPDLIIGTGQGVAVYTGTAGMGFVYAPDLSLNVTFSVSDVFTRDLDGNGTLEMVAACRNDSCINILTQQLSGEFVLMARADVPSGRYLASGDLDGDGKPDIVGTGDVLWTVLSSRAPQTAAPGTTQTNRTQSSEVVINEVLSQNTRVPLTADNGLKTDFLEIFNGAATPAVLTGWKLRLQSIQEGATVDQTWTLPAVTAGAKGHALVIFSEATGSMHTGFTLPAEGGTVTLLRPDNTVADRVVYPQAQENVSWSRYLDGHPSFRADRIPSPGMSNLDNGTVPPEVKLTAPSPATMVAGQPLTFTARGLDDAGIISLSLLWNRLDAPSEEPRRIVLYDDGMHQDAGAVDGFFAGQLAPGLPAGAEAQFYLEAVDLSGEVLLLPDNAELTGPGEAPVAWSFSLTTPPPLEITAVSTNNVTGLQDDVGGYPDYVIVRNTGSAPVDMSRILLAKSPLAGTSAVYAFPSGLMLPPAGEVTVFADNNPSQGALHAPFTLNAGGDDLSLLAVTPSGARQWIHSLSVPASVPDATYRRLPGSDLRAVIAATADLTNWSGTSWDANGTAMATVHFSTFTGFNYRIDGDAPGAPVAWTPLQSISGNGSVFTITRPLAQMAALRVVASTPPQIRVDAAIGGLSTAGIYGEARGITAALTLYYGLTDGGVTPAAWSNSVGGYNITSNSIVPLAWFLNSLNAGTNYFYRLKLDLPGGSASWLAGGTFRTLSADAGAATSLTLTQLNLADATVQIGLNPLTPPNGTVELLAGTVDAYNNVVAWQRRVPATLAAAGSNTWTANLSGLARETSYFVRARVVSTTGQIVSAPRLTFRTPDVKANLVMNLRLSEIMYNPVWPSPAEEAAGFERDDFEYIELHNPSSESMNLSGLWFEAGLDFAFPLSGGPVIPPGGYAVIAAHPHAFAMRYGASIPLAGWTLHPFRKARLANSGEFITLRASDGTILFSFEYDDNPGPTDGEGFSLEFRPPLDTLRAEDDEDYIMSRPGGSAGRSAIPDLNYHGWKTLTFTPAEINDPNVSGRDRDPDQDGLTNFMEYVCGTDPLIPGSPDVVNMGDPIWYGYHFVTFPVNPRASDITCFLDYGPSLQKWPDANWYSAGSGQSGGTLFSAVLSGGGNQVLLTFAIPQNPHNHRMFFRLRVSQP